MDFAIIAVIIAAWLAAAAIVAFVYGRVVARADHDNEMSAMHREQRTAPGSSEVDDVSTPRRSSAPPAPS